MYGAPYIDPIDPCCCVLPFVYNMKASLTVISVTSFPQQEKHVTLAIFLVVKPSLQVNTTI